MRQLLKRHFSDGAKTVPKMPQHIKRFYKNVDVIEHPQASDKALIPAGERVTFQNLHMSHDRYYAVTLDGRVTKTLYQDPLLLPSRALAVAIAEEWDSQKEKIDVQTLKLSQMMAKAVRTSLDPSLKAHMQKELLTILSNDQICFREALGTPNEYKAKLAEKQ
jgi:chaperone required for assembly of F1-ATPase